MKSKPELIGEMEMLLYFQKGKVILLFMNVNVNLICRNVSINLFIECKWCWKYIQY